MSGNGSYGGLYNFPGNILILCLGTRFITHLRVSHLWQITIFSLRLVMHKEKSFTNLLVRKIRIYQRCCIVFSSFKSKGFKEKWQKIERVENNFFTSVEKALRNKEHKQ